MFNYHLQQTEAERRNFISNCFSALNENIQFGPEMLKSAEMSQSADFKSQWRVGLLSEYVIMLWIQPVSQKAERNLKVDVYIFHTCTFKILINIKIIDTIMKMNLRVERDTEGWKQKSKWTERSVEETPGKTVKIKEHYFI